MGLTRSQLVQLAFEEIGLPTYVFDLQPEQLDAAIRRLDTMMGEWDSEGLRVGFPLSNSWDGIDADQDTGLPAGAREAVVTNLAIRLAPTMGKMPSDTTKARASISYSNLCAVCIQPEILQLPGTMPMGAGTKSWRNNQNFVIPPSQTTLPPPEDDLILS